MLEGTYSNPSSAVAGPDFNGSGKTHVSLLILPSFIGPAFTDGGPVAVVYGFICAAIGVSLIFASLAEMASM